MEEEKIKDNNSKVEDRIQKKSEKDRNGVIGGLVFGIFFAFLAYQIYIRAFELPIGKILVYGLGILSFLCLAVTVSCFFDYKESKKIEKLDEEARREEKEFSEIDPEKRALRAEKMFRMNQKELMRYEFGSNKISLWTWNYNDTDWHSNSNCSYIHVYDVRSG